MSAGKKFYKNLAFLLDHDFEFVFQQKWPEQIFIFRKNELEIGFYHKVEQLDWTIYLYYTINGKKTILDVEDEFYKLFKIKTKKNSFWELAKVLKEQLKEGKIFGHQI